jgi:RecB family endonuclease NucS
MEVFNLKNDKVEEVELKPFKLERDIQNLVEKNTETFFQLEFISSELTVGKYRIDSLCYDNENNSFVIIEYKKGNSYSVIDQGYTYLQLLLNNKIRFSFNPLSTL